MTGARHRPLRELRGGADEAAHTPLCPLPLFLSACSFFPREALGLACLGLEGTVETSPLRLEPLVCPVG